MWRAIRAGDALSKAPARINTGIAVTDVDFGFNFDTVVNTKDTGQGSLRQALVNSNTLGGEASLAQAGFRKDAAGANQALPAGSETALLMIPAAQLTVSNIGGTRWGIGFPIQTKEKNLKQDSPEEVLLSEN